MGPNLNQKQKVREAVIKAKEAYLAPIVEESKKHLPDGAKSVTPKMLREMQEYGERWLKRHPLGTREQMTKAVSLYFNVNIIDTSKPDAD
jgi:hypothetical protein